MGLNKESQNSLFQKQNKKRIKKELEFRYMNANLFLKSNTQFLKLFSL